MVLIEDQASGTRLIQEPVADGPPRGDPQSDKIMCMQAKRGFGSTRAPPGAQSSSIEFSILSKSYFSRRERRRYWGAKGHQLDFVPSRCLRPAVFQQGFWFTPQAEPEVWNQRNDPLSIVAADIGLPELSSIVICSSVPT